MNLPNLSGCFFFLMFMKVPYMEHFAAYGNIVEYQYCQIECHACQKGRVEVGGTVTGVQLAEQRQIVASQYDGNNYRQCQHQRVEADGEQMVGACHSRT